jgi:hypothetical protein
MLEIPTDMERGEMDMANFHFHQITVQRQGDVFCVRLKHRRMNELELHNLGEELNQLVTENGCRLMALALGFDQIECLYSSFIGKMMATRKLLLENGGHLKLCEVGPASLGVLKTCKLVELFDIHPDMTSTIEALKAAG